MEQQREYSWMTQQKRKRNVLQRFSSPVDFDMDGNIIKDKVGRYRVRCTRCGTTIGSQYDFYKHYECHIRQDSGDNKCPHPNCGKVFTSRSSYGRHIRLKHSTLPGVPNSVVVGQPPLRPLAVRPSAVRPYDNEEKKYVPFWKGSPVATIQPVVSSPLVPVRPIPLYPRIFSSKVPLSFPFPY